MSNPVGLYRHSAPNQAFPRFGTLATVLLAVMLASCAALTQPTSRYSRAPRPTPSVPTPGPRNPGGREADSAIVTGHVWTTSHLPAAGAEITFWMTASAKCPRCGRRTMVETGPDGKYTIALKEGGYSASCVATGPCGAEGTSGGDSTFSLPPNRTLNFILCDSSEDIPQCLSP